MRARLTKDSLSSSADFAECAEGHKCRRVHGHSFKVEVSVEGEVDPEIGWVYDHARDQRCDEPLLKKCWITRTSTTSKDWKIRRLKKWQNGSGKNWNHNARPLRDRGARKPTARCAIAADNKERRPGQPSIRISRLESRHSLKRRSSYNSMA